MALETRPAPLTTAYEHCRVYTRQRATNFYYAFASLPGAKRRAIYAAYAFAGYVDDIVDDADDDAARRAGLRDAEQLLDRAYAATANTSDSATDSADPESDWLAAALSDAVQRFAIPRPYFDELLAGMVQDIDQDRYASFADLERYCYRAASVIGLICVEIFGYDRARAALAHEAAVDMGKALQLTNILRDVKEDAARNRIYLAQDDLARHGVSDADVRAGVLTVPLRALLAEYAARAAAFYESGARLIPLLDGPRSRMCCNGLQGVYRSILDEIIRRDYDVFSERVSPSKAGRLLRLFRLWVTGAWPFWS